MSFRKSGFVANSGITVDTLLISDQLRVGDKIKLNEDGSDIIEGNLQFSSLANNGNEIVFANNKGLLGEVAKPVATGRYLTYNPSTEVYSFVDIATEEGFLKDDQTATITAVFTFSTTPKFSALSNGFLKITSGDGTIASASIATADLPNTISPQLLNTNFLNIVSLLSTNDKYFIDYSGSGDRLDIHHVDSSSGSDVTTDIISFSKTTFQLKTSSYQSAGVLTTSATGVVSVSASSTLDGFPITIGSTSITASSTTNSLLGLTSLSSTKIDTDEVIINTNDGADTFVFKQGVAGSGGIDSLELKAGSNRILICNPNSSIALGSHYETVGFLQTNASGQVTTGSIGTSDLPSGIPNSNLANSSVTLGSTAVSLGATQASNTTYTNVGGDNVVINTSNGAETFTWRQGSAGGSDVANLELNASVGSVNTMMKINNLGGITFNSAYSTGILHCDASANITSSALVVGDLPSNIPIANLSSTDTIFTLGSNNVTAGETVSSISGVSNIGFTGELRYNNSTSNYKTEYSTALSADFLTTKHSSDELQKFTKTSGGDFSITNKINVINEGYNSFDTSTNKYRIGILPSDFAVANNDQGSGNITPVFILRNSTSSKAKFGASHESNAVELYYFTAIPYGYKAHSLRINCFAETDGSEVSETVGISRYYITSTGNSWLSTTETTNSLYTFDPADNVQTTSLDDAYYLVVQVHHTTGNVLKGGFIDLESIV